MTPFDSAWEHGRRTYRQAVRARALYGRFRRTDRAACRGVLPGDDRRTANLIRRLMRRWPYVAWLDHRAAERLYYRLQDLEADASVEAEHARALLLAAWDRCGRLTPSLTGLGRVNTVGAMLDDGGYLTVWPPWRPLDDDGGDPWRMS
jgi:hypothetical protein